MRYFLLIILITLFPSFSLSDEVTVEAQRLLKELGYNPGPVDGLIGGKTRNAMSNAFKSVGKEWDRELDETDLTVLKDILKQQTNGEPKTLAAAQTISSNDLGLPITYGENHEPYVDFASFEDDLINLSKITCIYSTGKKAKKCTTQLSPPFHFPKHGLKMQTEIVRSGKVALKFRNGQNDCGWHHSTSDCTPIKTDGKKSGHRERSEISVRSWDTSPKWMKFSMFIPKESAFDPPIQTSLWQIHMRGTSPAFKVRYHPLGHLLWGDMPNNSFGAGWNYTKIIPADEVRDQWHDFLVRIDFAEHPEKGAIKVWINGEPKIDYVGYTQHGTSNQSYMKFGIYKSHTDRFSKQHKGNPPDREETILYYDAIAVGNTCADLNLTQEGYNCSSFED